MASIRSNTSKLGRTTFSVRYRHTEAPGGATVNGSTVFDTLAEAEGFAALVDRLGAEGARQYRGKINQGGTTLAQWVERYLSTRPDNDTTGQYRAYLRCDIAGQPIGDIPLAQITREDIAGWVKWLQTDKTVNDRTAAGNSEKTTINKLSFLKTALNAAMLDAHIARNPALGVRPDRTEKRRHQIALSHREYDLVRDAMAGHYENFVQFLVETGCRFNEATALTPADIDRDTCRVTFARTFRRGQASGRGHHIGPTKTKGSERTITVRAALIDALAYSEGDAYVFTNTTGGPIRINTFRANVWTKRLGRAPLPAHRQPSLHDLRHTHASWLIDAGWDALKIQKRLGHSDIKTTYNVYGHLLHHDDDTVQAALDKALTG
jgi:integrase